MSIAKIIDRGARLLDEKKPGWEHAVDLNKLDMSVPDKDVLSQVFGEYFDGFKALGTTYPPMDYGFDEGLASYDDLTEAWREIIESRRGSQSQLF